MIYVHSMQRAVQYYADRPALRVGDRLLTFQELHNRVKGLVARSEEHTSELQSL
jgi:hypothetical protein